MSRHPEFVEPFVAYIGIQREKRAGRREGKRDKMKKSER